MKCKFQMQFPSQQQQKLSVGKSLHVLGPHSKQCRWMVFLLKLLSFPSVPERERGGKTPLKSRAFKIPFHFINYIISIKWVSKTPLLLALCWWWWWWWQRSRRRRRSSFPEARKNTERQTLRGLLGCVAAFGGRNFPFDENRRRPE